MERRRIWRSTRIHSLSVTLHYMTCYLMTYFTFLKIWILQVMRMMLQYIYSKKTVSVINADLFTVVSDRFARAFNRTGATRAVALDIFKIFHRVWHAGHFTSLSLMESQVSYLALFLLFSVIDDLEWFWIESLHRNIQLMLEFLKAPFLVLHFCYYTLITFLTMLSVILLSMLMILLSILSVVGHLIGGNNLNWLLNLNLLYEALWTGVRSGC